MGTTERIYSLIKSVKIKTLLLSLFIVFSSCGGGDGDPKPAGPTDPPDPTIEELQAEVKAKLTSTWAPTSVVRNDIDDISSYANFSLTIGNGTYTAQNGKHVWPNSGTWKFVEGKTDQIIRDNEVIMDLAVGANLTLSFDFEENVFSTGGRTQNVSSSYVFVLSK